MERKELEALGVEAEKIEKIIALHGQSMQKLQAQVTAVETERDGIKTQLADVTTKLDAFKDFKPDEMKAEAEKLKTEIVNLKQAHEDERSARNFNDLLSTKITSAGGINAKAIISLLDIETIKGSKEQTAEIEKQLTVLKESDANQFKSEQGAPQPAAGTGTGTPPAERSTLFQKLNEHRIVGK